MTIGTVLGWASLTWRRGRAAGRGSVGAVTVVVAVLAALLCLTDGAGRAVSRDLLESGGLTQIDVASFDDRASVRPLTTDALEGIARVPRVEAVEPVHGATLYAAPDSGLPGFSLPARSWRPSLDVPIVEGEAERLDADEVVLPARAQGVDFQALVGEGIEVGYTVRTGPDEGTSASTSVQVAAVYDPSYQVDGVEVAYAPNDRVARWAAAREGLDVERFQRSVGADRAVVVAEDQAAVAPVTEALQGLGFAAVPVAERIRRLPGVLRALAPLGTLVLAAAVGLAGLLGASAVRQSVAARVRELAVLRVLGWRVGDVRRLLVAESTISGAVAGVTGTVAGVALALALTPALQALLGLPVSPGDVLRPVVLLVPLVPLVSVTAGALLAARRTLRVDPYLTARRLG